MSGFLIFTFVLLILFVGLPTAFQSGNAIDLDLECPDNKVIIVRTTNPDPICVFDTTAYRWVNMGIAEYVEDTKTESLETIPVEETYHLPVDKTENKLPAGNTENTLPEVLGNFASTILDYEYDYVPDELSRAQSYLVTFSNGDFVEPMTIQTFSKVEPGDGPHVLPSFQQEGFDTYFSLESTPNKDQIEFYNLVAKTINPGKSPELFDVAIDVLAGDNSVILSINYSKCEITDYLPYTQDYLLFYQFSDTFGKEIRDSATIYCNGLDLEVYNEEDEKIISDENLPYHSNLDDNIVGYVVHFYGPDFDGLNTITTFSDFSPSIDFAQSPFDTITIPGHTFDSKPQFFLESLPSVDKLELYEYYAMHVNPGTPPEPVDVSIDLITGDGTILQRWNYVDCTFYDHSSFLEDSFLKFSYAETLRPEIRDKSEFTCVGNNLEVHGDTPISKFPVTDSENKDDDSEIFPVIADLENRANSFRISAFDGEFEKTHSAENVQKFESITRDRGPLTPINHAKQFDYGFVIESLPEKNKASFYEFISRYVNPGKSPEPFDVSLDMVTGDKNILYTLEYTNCGAVDFWWYLQQGTWFYQFSDSGDGEIRERYIFYCNGFGVGFP